MGRSLQVVIDNLQQVYFPGQQVAGKVVLTISEELKVRSIICRLQGFADVRWTETHHSNNSTHTVTYSSHETYCDQPIILFQPEGKEAVLSPNTYTYAFSAQIPLGVPSSYEAHIGRVRYQVKADVDRPWAFDMHAKHMLTVMSPLDLNALPNLSNGSTAKDQKVLCCLCCASDPIIAEVKIDRQGYVPGEAITFRAEIENQSSREMTCSKASLIMEVRYITARKTRVVRNIVNELRHGKIDGGGTDTWAGERLHIPAVPPSFLPGCNIIDIRYFMTIIVDPSGPGFDLCVPLEVTIGSIPLRHVAEQHGLVLPSAPPPAYGEATRSTLDPAPGAPRDIYNDPAMPPAPLPKTMFAESAMGRVSTVEAGDNEHTYGNTEYAPVYTYYNWDKPDTNKMFSVQMQER